MILWKKEWCRWRKADEKQHHSFSFIRGGVRQREMILMQPYFGVGMCFAAFLLKMDKKEGDLSDYVRDYRSNGR